jgi:hemerythrin superfamily protein
MNRKVFLGYCYCDSRFRTIENIIKNGTMEEVFEIQEVNESMPKMHRYREVFSLLKERLNGL